MQYPFKSLPKPHQPEKKNFSVIKFDERMQVVKTLMVCLTKVEAEGVARAGNRFNIARGIKDYFRVKEEHFD